VKWAKRMISVEQNNIETYAIVIIVIVALFLRLGYAISLPNQLSFDEPTYNDIVTNLLTGHGYSFSGSAYYTSLPFQPTSFQEPMYPLFLATIYTAAGLGMFKVARAVQAVLNTGSVILLMLLASSVWGKREAILTGVISSIHIPFVYLTGLLMTENLFIFILLLFVYFWIISVQRNKAWLFLVTGIIFGLACLTRGMTLYFLPVLLFTTILVTHRTFFRSLYTVTCLLIGVVAIIAPWTWRNYTIHNAFIPVTTKGGYNLYIYTYPAACLDFNSRFDQIPIPNMNGLTEIERETTFRNLAIENIKSHPFLEVKFAIYKLLDFWNPVAERGPWYIRLVYVVEFLIVMVFAIYCLFHAFAIKDQRALGLLLALLVLFHTFGAALFTGGGKARMTIEPILVLLAGSGMVLMLEKVVFHGFVKRSL